MDDEHLAVSNQNGTFEFGFDTVMNSTWSKVLIYKLKDKLTLIRQIDLSQIVGVDGIQFKNNILMVTTRRANKNIFVDNTNNESFTKDSAEVKLFKCDNKLIEYKTNISTNGHFLTNDKLLLNEQSLNNFPGNFYITDKYFDYHSKNYLSPPFALFDSSKKWLLVAGSNAEPDLYNINLYRI